MNRILTFSVITVVTVIMGSSAVLPAIADDNGILGICPGGQIWDPNTFSCIPSDSCPNGISFDGGIHCSLDSDINDDKKIVICHQPSNSKSNSVTIEVSSNAVEKHLDHGDTIGACYI